MTAAAREQALRDYLASNPVSWLDRVIVLDSCASTQDEAFAASGGQPKLLLTTLEQTAGRGRLGRPWHQSRGLGLAVTFVLASDLQDPRSLPLRVACAVCRACEAGVQVTGRLAWQYRCWIKWPNDVLAASPKGDKAYRKLAGVLIEKRDNVFLVGVGINVNQRATDWPTELKAVSLAEIDASLPESARPSARRHEVLCQHLIAALNHYLFAHRLEIEEEFRARDPISGTRQTVIHDGRRVTGLIRCIEPLDAIEVEMAPGQIERLPAATSTLAPPN